jgi:hypothetical protein
MTVTEAAETRADSEEPGGRPRRTRWWKTGRWVALVVAVALVPVGWSYASALAKPGTDGWKVRSVEWLRDHGGTAPVNAIEHWWYSHHPPSKGGAPAAILTHPGRTETTVLAPEVKRLPPPANLQPLESPALPAEGIWRPAGRLVHGVPGLYVTAVRPDLVHSSLATGVAWMDPTLLRTVMYAGVQLPGGTWANQAPIPPSLRASLVAAFNSGFKLQDSRGGYYAEGKEVRPLIGGAASFVIDDTGRPTVGAWGRDIGMGPHVSSVRQNLALIVDGGAPVPGLDDNTRGRWGFTLGNKVLVWRSGVGVTSNGALVFAAGNGLSAATLARVLVAAGAARAMELDINSQWTRFFIYDAPDPAHPDAVEGTKLVPDIRSSPRLYLENETRDFFALFAR